MNFRALLLYYIIVRKIAGSLVLAILAVTSCHREEPKPAYINIEPKTDTLNPGEGSQFRATVVDQYGDPLPGATVAWDVSDTFIITVDQWGVVEAWNPGYAYLRASYEDIKDSAFVVVKEPLGTHDLFISGRLIMTDTSFAFPQAGWLRLEVRQDSAGGPFIPGATVYLISGLDTLVDTMTTASVLWAKDLSLQEGKTYRIKVLYLGRYGVDTIRMPPYCLLINEPGAWDTVTAYADLLVRWAINTPPMAKELAYYNNHDVVGYDPTYSFYTENLMYPDTVTVPGSYVLPPLGTVVVSALDKKDFHGLGAFGAMLVGKTAVAPVYIQ